MSDILRWAKEAGNGKIREWQNCHLFYPDELERFAALVRADEREKCAAMFADEDCLFEGKHIAAAIRAKSEA